MILTKCSLSLYIGHQPELALADQRNWLLLHSHLRTGAVLCGFAIRILHVQKGLKSEATVGRTKEIGRCK